MTKVLTHGSLFSGIGGAELAAHWAGFANLFHCEINPFGKRVLDYWFSQSKSYDDVTKTDFTEWRGRVDVLTAGFPCQPFSTAGNRKGADDDRYLWPETLRVLREIKPAWFVGENVAGLLTMVEQREVTPMGSQATLFSEGDGLFHYRATELYTIERICRELNTAGYSVQPFVIPACAVGAPHRRDRVWIVARRTDDAGDIRRVLQGGTVADTPNQRDTTPRGAMGQERPQDSQIGEGLLAQPLRQGEPTTPNPYDLRLAATTASRVWGEGGRDGLQSRPDGEEKRTDPLRESAIGTATHPSSVGLQTDDTQGGEPLCQPDRHSLQREIPHPDWRAFPTQPPLLGGDDGLPFGMDALTISYGKFRTETIKAMGNAWVPQVAYEIFRAIKEAEDGE